MPTQATSLVTLRDQVTAFRDRADSLRERVERILSEMQEIERRIATLTGASRTRAAPTRSAARAAGRGKGGRRPAGQNLASVLERVLRASSRPLGIRAIVVAARRAGYASSSPSFPRIVGMRLGDRKRFRRVGRGVYTTASAGPARG